MNKNKKVIAINSSRRQGNTYALLAELQEKLGSQGIDVEIINLFDYRIDDCIGCERCIRGGKCTRQDDVEALMQKLLSADGLIISSPVYMGSVTGRLKTFIDRTCRWYHRPELTGIPVLLVATTAGSSLQYILNYLAKVAVDWGMHPTGQIGRTISELNSKITEKEINKFRDCLFNDRESFRPSFKQMISFQVQRVLAAKILDSDKKYWKEKGWDKSLYYYECRIGLFKKILAFLFYRFMYSRIEKIEE